MRSRSSKRNPNNNNASYLYQPDLWQASTSEEIIRLLIALDFSGTEAAFDNWMLKVANDSLEKLEKKEPAAFAALQAAKDWRSKLEGWNNTGKLLNPISKEKLEHLLDDYLAYDFGKWLTNFSASLLQLFYRLTQDIIKTYLPKESSTGVPQQDICSQQVSPKEGPLAPYQHQQSAIYELIARITTLLLQQKKVPKAQVQALDLLKEARKAFPQDGMLAYLLAACFYQKNQKKDGKQQYAKCLLYFPELSEKFINQNSLLAIPKEIQRLLKNQQPARAVALGTIQGVFQLIELPKDFSLKDSTNQRALDGYHALHLVTQAEISPTKNLSKITSYRKHLQETDPEIYKKYMANVKSRENS